MDTFPLGLFHQEYFEEKQDIFVLCHRMERSTQNVDPFCYVIKLRISSRITKKQQPLLLGLGKHSLSDISLPYSLTTFSFFALKLSEFNVIRTLITSPEKIPLQLQQRSRIYKSVGSRVQADLWPTIFLIRPKNGCNSCIS